MGRRRLPGATGAPRVSTAWLALMASTVPGLSFCWVLKYALATPHLAHTLGASAAVSHALWALNPLTGLLSLLISTLSDGHASRYGRRRPFVAAGAAASVVGMTVFPWAGSVLPVADRQQAGPPPLSCGLWIDSASSVVAIPSWRSLTRTPRFPVRPRRVRRHPAPFLRPVLRHPLVTPLRPLHSPVRPLPPPAATHHDHRRHGGARARRAARLPWGSSC